MTPNSPDPGEAMLAACLTAGLDASGAVLLRHGTNAIYLLPAEGAVARVCLGIDAYERAVRVHTVTTWLANRYDFPTTVPLAGTTPIAVGTDRAVSFWNYYPQPEDTKPDSGTLATLLRLLHGIADAPSPLPRWMPLTSLENTLRQPAFTQVVAPAELQWISQRIAETRQSLANLQWPLGRGLIHGDAWAGNLLRRAEGNSAGAIILGDWDWTSIGPREVDLVPTWHAAIRYGKGPAWIDRFLRNYDYDLAAWNGFPAIMAMRDLVQLTGPLRRAATSAQHHAALRQRLDALLREDNAAIWTPL
jgi:hypothetical protein